MAQPGDPHAVEREARAEEAARVARGVDGSINHYAAQVRREVLAGLFYLARWRQLGAAEAGRQTCARFGHDPAGRTCMRCNAYIA